MDLNYGHPEDYAQVVPIHDCMCGTIEGRAEETLFHCVRPATFCFQKIMGLGAAEFLYVCSRHYDPNIMWDAKGLKSKAYFDTYYYI